MFSSSRCAALVIYHLAPLTYRHLPTHSPRLPSLNPHSIHTAFDRHLSTYTALDIANCRPTALDRHLLTHNRAVPLSYASRHLSIRSPRSTSPSRACSGRTSYLRLSVSPYPALMPPCPAPSHAAPPPRQGTSRPSPPHHPFSRARSTPSCQTVQQRRQHRLRTALSILISPLPRHPPHTAAPEPVPDADALGLTRLPMPPRPSHLSAPPNST